MEDFASWSETLAVAADPELVAQLVASRAEFERGEEVAAEELGALMAQRRAREER